MIVLLAWELVINYKNWSQDTPNNNIVKFSFTFLLIFISENLPTFVIGINETSAFTFSDGNN